MSDQLAIAIVGAAGSTLVSITALLLNFRLFGSLERRLEIVEQDLKQFFKILAEHDKRISKLEG